MTDDEPPSSWRAIRAEIQRAVPESAWEQWLAPIRARRLDGATLVLEAPDEIRGWVGGRFAPLLQACAAAVLGPGARIELGVPPRPGARETGALRRGAGRGASIRATPSTSS